MLALGLAGFVAAATWTPSLAVAKDSYAVDCGKCAAQIPQYYAKNKAKSEDYAAALARFSDCFDRSSKNDMGSLVSPQELRNLFEATGEVFKFQTLYENRDWMGKEEDYLKQAVQSGYWKATWGFGTTDCLKHAQTLKQHLDELFAKQGVSDRFKVEVANSYDDTKATDTAANVAPVSNHFIVRIISLATGRSYTGDVYTGFTKFSRESENGRVVLNDFESCLVDKVLAAKRGGGISDGNVSAILDTFKPGVRSNLANAAKLAAGQCLRGAKQATVEDYGLW
jgi:hypothetical protein